MMGEALSPELNQKLAAQFPSWIKRRFSRSNANGPGLQTHRDVPNRFDNSSRRIRRPDSWLYL